MSVSAAVDGAIWFVIDVMDDDGAYVPKPAQLKPLSTEYHIIKGRGNKISGANMFSASLIPEQRFGNGPGPLKVSKVLFFGKLVDEAIQGYLN